MTDEWKCHMCGFEDVQNYVTCYMDIGVEMYFANITRNKLLQDDQS